MRKIKWVVCLTVLLVALVLLVCYVALRNVPEDTLLPRVQDLLENALGMPVSLGKMDIAGLKTVRFENLAVPSVASDPPTPPWLAVERGTVTVEWGKLFPPRAPTLELEAEGLSLDLVHDSERGWNFLAREQDRGPDRGSRSSDPADRADGAKKGKDLAFSLTAKDSECLVRDDRWGEWKVILPDSVSLDWRQGDQPNSHHLIVKGTCEVEGALPESQLTRIQPVVRDLIELFSVGQRQASIDCQAKLTEAGWEVSSPHRDSVIVRSEGVELRSGRFRLAGPSNPDSVQDPLSTASFEAIELSAPSWRVPLVENLRFPWTKVPDDLVRIVFRDLQYDRDRVQFLLEGIRFREMALARTFLPWTHLLSQPEDWRLEEVGASFQIQIRPRDKTVQWEDGLIEFADGRQGTIKSRGTFAQGDPSDWKVHLEVDRLPVPDQWVQDATFSLGILSGKMTWGQSSGLPEASGLVGSGTVVLSGGEMGSIRLLDGIEDLLELDDLERDRFERFAFGFDMQTDKVAIEPLQLDSAILQMQGGGSFGPGPRVDVTVDVRPSLELAGAVKSGRASGIVGGIAAATDPVKVQITGSLTNPSYKFIAGKGMKIPLGDLKWDY